MVDIMFVMSKWRGGKPKATSDNSAVIGMCHPEASLSTPEAIKVWAFLSAV